MKKWILALLLCLMPSLASATTYYVAYDSTDTTSARSCGTIQSSGTPGKTIRQGLKCLAAGDTLIIKSGTYTGTENRIDSQCYWTGNAAGACALSSGSAQMVTGTNSTTGAITITTNDGGRFTIQVPGNYPCIRFSNPGRNYYHISNFVCDMSAQLAGTDEGGNNAIYLSDGSSFNIFDQFEAFGGYGNGVGANANGGSADSNIWSNCHVHHFDDLDGPGGVRRVNGAYGFYYDSQNNTIDNCEIDHNGGYGIHLYSFSDSASGNIIKNNTVHHNGASGGENYGILVSRGTGIYVYNNLVYDNRGGIRVYTNCITCLILNNTIVNNTATGTNYGGIWLQYYTSGVVVKNNVLYNNSTVTCGGVSQYADWGPDSACTGVATQSNNYITTSNPGFLNPAASPPNLHITSSATNLYNQGTATGVSGTVTVDKDGNSRPQGGTYDIGAYEVTSGTSVSIDTTSIGDGQRTAAYSQVVSVSGGSGTYSSCSVTVGSIPTGLSCSISSNQGLISGTPTVTNSFSFTIQICDNAAACDTQAYSVVIADIDTTCSDVVSGSWTLHHCPGASATSSTGNAVTGAVNTTGSDLGLCAIAADKDATFPTMQDNKSNTWTLVGSLVSAQYGKIGLYYSRMSSVGSGHTFTANAGGNASFAAIQCAIFTGSRVSPADLTGLATSIFDDTDIDAGTLVITSTKELSVLAAQTESVDTLTATSGYTIYQRAIQSGKAFGVALAWNTHITTAAPQPTFSWSSPMDASAMSGSFFATDSQSSSNSKVRVRILSR